MATIDRIAALAVAAVMVLAASCSSSGGKKATGPSVTAAPGTSSPSGPSGPSGTSATTAPATPTSSLLGGADLTGYSVTSQPAPTPIPCGSHFGDTASSTTQAAVAFATSGNQQTVNETVAVYPTAAAATAVATAFRTTGPSCAQFDDTLGPVTTYQVKALSPPAVTADDVVAVALASPAHFYDLVLLRSGPRLAWLALGQIGNPVDPAVLTSVAGAAAKRLAA